MSERIYYVGWRLSARSRADLSKHYRTDCNFHATVIYSRKWFPYKDATVRGPILAHADGHNKLGSMLVLMLQSNILCTRHRELIDAGATFDYPVYQPHISIAQAGEKDDYFPFDGEIVLNREYYGTWEEEKE